MKEKIINIRNILKIIISLFIIFTMIKSCGKAFTWTEFEQRINEANNKYLTYFNNDGNSGHVPTFKYFLDSTYWANNYTTYGAKFEDYDSFLITTLADNNVISVNLFLFNEIDFNVTNANLMRGTKDNQNFYLSYINPVGNQSIKRIRFYTPRNNLNGFYLDSEYNVTGFPTNTQSDHCILWTTGNITNVNNYIIFGGKINVLTPLEFDQDTLDIVSYNGSLARSYQRRYI